MPHSNCTYANVHNYEDPERMYIKLGEGGQVCKIMGTRIPISKTSTDAHWVQFTNLTVLDIAQHYFKYDV